VYGVQDRQPRTGDPQRGTPQQLLKIRFIDHLPSLAADLESVKIYWRA
jgi:hypothetical protein